MASSAQNMHMILRSSVPLKSARRCGSAGTGPERAIFDMHYDFARSDPHSSALASVSNGRVMDLFRNTVRPFS